MTSLRVIYAKTINLFNLYGSQRCYSIFPSSYIKPIYRNEELEELRKTGKAEELIYSSIRPALTSQTSSVFHDKDISLFTRYVMRNGNIVLAKSLVQQSFENIKRIQIAKYHKVPNKQKDDIEVDPKVIFHKAVENCKPLLELTVCRKGGIRYKIPIEVTENRSRFLAMNWLIKAAQNKKRSIHFPEELARQLIAASNKEGPVILRKQDLYKACVANRAYAHFRWQK